MLIHERSTKYMKKAILITGIIWGILCVIGALIMLPLGAAATTPEFVQELMKAGQVTEAEAKAVALVTAEILFSIGAWLLVGGVFSFVLAGIRNKGFSKGAGIALGIIGIVVGAELPGIFMIVDSAVNR